MFNSFARFAYAIAKRPALAIGNRPLIERATAALVVALLLLAGSLPAALPAYAYNCLNVVLRDGYWGQYRRIVENGWNASGVGVAFARNGFAVNGTPTVGSIMVWPPGYYGASGTGHVAVVAAVYGNGTVLVRHENWPFGSAEHAQVFTVRPGHQFVHPALVAAAPVRQTESLAQATDENTATAEESIVAATVVATS